MGRYDKGTLIEKFENYNGALWLKNYCVDYRINARIDSVLDGSHDANGLIDHYICVISLKQKQTPKLQYLKGLAEGIRIVTEGE